jgi:hypothetical protein
MLVGVAFLAILVAALSGFSLHLANTATTVDYANTARTVSVVALCGSSIALVGGSAYLFSQREKIG